MSIILLTVAIYLTCGLAWCAASTTDADFAELELSVTRHLRISETLYRRRWTSGQETFIRGCGVLGFMLYAVTLWPRHLARRLTRPKPDA